MNEEDAFTLPELIGGWAVGCLLAPAAGRLYQLLMSLRDTHEAMKAFGVGAGFKPAPTQFSRQGPALAGPKPGSGTLGFSLWLRKNLTPPRM